jgi:anti-sigma-K factor RskA
MSCQELQDMYELYALGVLEGEEKAEIDEHLSRGCENCRRGLADARAFNAVLLSIGPAETPSRRLRHRLLASIGYERPGWFWTGALAAALMLALALWMGSQERERSNQLADARKTLLQVTGERDRLNQALRFLSDPETQPASFGKGQQAPPRGYVFVHPQLGVMLIASNLPAAGAGKTYEMWMIPKTGAPRPAGLFQSDGMRGLYILNGPLDLDALNAIAVTLEPATGSTAPTTMPVIVVPTGG